MICSATMTKGICSYKGRTVNISAGLLQHIIGNPIEQAFWPFSQNTGRVVRIHSGCICFSFFQFFSLIIYGYDGYDISYVRLAITGLPNIHLIHPSISNRHIFCIIQHASPAWIITVNKTLQEISETFHTQTESNNCIMLGHIQQRSPTWPLQYQSSMHKLPPLLPGEAKSIN